MTKVSIHKAQTPEDHRVSADLVARIYRHEAYITEDQDGARQRLQSLMGSSHAHTYQALFGETLAGTISLFEGMSAPLPLESIYADEMAELRNAGHVLVEVGCFAVDREALLAMGCNQGDMLDVSTRLMRETFDHSIKRAVSAVCIAINPKHESFYAALGFVDAGPLKTYPAVNNAPALAKMLPLQTMLENYRAGTMRNGFMAQLLQGV